MIMDWDAEFSEKVNDSAIKMYGVNCTYQSPQGGVPVQVRVIFNEAAIGFGFGGYTEMRPEVHVLVSTIPSPDVGGLFEVRGQRWVIDQPPKRLDTRWVLAVRLDE
jgi:hypothetical protein